jgi:ATP-dependent protease ClpP protease subunit
MNTAVRYIRRLATGDFSQGQAFWVILIPTVLAIKATAELLSLFNMIQNPVVSTRIWGTVAIFVMFILLPLIFFGCARAIIIHSRQFKGGNESILLLLATAFTAYLCVSDVIKHADVFQSMAAIAFKQDDMSIQILAKGEQTALLSGQLTYNTTQKLSKWLKQHPNIQTIELNIDAGHLHEARSLAKLIIKNKLDTQVTDRCAASCMLVMAAGQNRVVSENATLQFHRTKGYDNGYRSEWIIEKEREKDRSYYKTRGVDEGYLYPIYYKQKNDDYLTPSLDSLLAYGVITAIK